MHQTADQPERGQVSAKNPDAQAIACQIAAMDDQHRKIQDSGCDHQVGHVAQVPPIALDQRPQQPDAEGHTGDIRWNFEKFLVGRDGEVVARFSPMVEPEAPEVTAAIEQALDAK